MLKNISIIKSTRCSIYQYIYPTRCNFTQLIYTYIWKLLYMFRALFPPIIRSAYKCIYSIWYLSDRYCYLPLAAGRINGLTNTRCCRYSCMRSWWWLEVRPETCRTVSRYNKRCNVASCWTYIGISRRELAKMWSSRKLSESLGHPNIFSNTD